MACDRMTGETRFLSFLPTPIAKPSVKAARFFPECALGAIGIRRRFLLRVVAVQGPLESFEPSFDGSFRPEEPSL